MYSNIAKSFIAMLLVNQNTAKLDALRIKRENFFGSNSSEHNTNSNTATGSATGSHHNNATSVPGFLQMDAKGDDTNASGTKGNPCVLASSEPKDPSVVSVLEVRSIVFGMQVPECYQSGSRENRDRMPGTAITRAGNPQAFMVDATPSRTRQITDASTVTRRITPAAPTLPQTSLDIIEGARR